MWSDRAQDGHSNAGTGGSSLICPNAIGKGRWCLADIGDSACGGQGHYAITGKGDCGKSDCFTTSREGCRRRPAGQPVGGVGHPEME